ncbi:hypothetical protein Tco_0801438 [Tanacetum coccineum]|uniref:Uncharacterized protein n=1 Tax=Tanacetum coccineum TaxID=301880 RepID=A0ABQ4ZVY6_9ASTR
MLGDVRVWLGIRRYRIKSGKTSRLSKALKGDIFGVQRVFSRCLFLMKDEFWIELVGRLLAIMGSIEVYKKLVVRWGSSVFTGMAKWMDQLSHGQDVCSYSFSRIEIFGGCECAMFEGWDVLSSRSGAISRLSSNNSRFRQMLASLANGSNVLIRYVGRPISVGKTASDP